MSGVAWQCDRKTSKIGKNDTPKTARGSQSHRNVWPPTFAAFCISACRGYDFALPANKREQRVSFFKELQQRNVLRVGAAYIVASWLVIQVVETLFPVFGLSQVAIRVVVIILAIGFIPVLVFSWAFELTPDGLKLEKDVSRDETTTPQNTKKLDRLIMAVLALGLAFFAFDKFVLDPARDVEIAQSAREEGRTDALLESFGDKSIAVLPFVNLSADPDQDYLGDGLAEELLNLLRRIPELRVISRSSAFSFKGQNIEIPVIAERLNVVHILEGSVRRSGDLIRISAQLVDARSDTQLWSDTFDEPIGDIFAIQEEVASQVVARLRVTLVPERPRKVEPDLAAYVIYLQARQILKLQQYDRLLE